MNDCKHLIDCGVNVCDGSSKSCVDYEMDPQIARDNDTVENTAKQTLDHLSYKDLYMKACGVIMEQHDKINKLEYDNNLMDEFIRKSGREKLIRDIVSGNENGEN